MQAQGEHEERRTAYLAYLVRLWQTEPAGPWRASARHVHHGDEHHFGSLDALYAFLHRQTDARDGEAP